MPLPSPTPGLVIGYRYLWTTEARSGQQEGRKTRPCVIILAVEDAKGEKLVTVAPITHSEPCGQDDAVELPQTTKRRLGLDEERSWVIISEVNRFTWPGPDLSPISWKQPDRFEAGFLPPRLFDDIKTRLIVLAKERRLSAVPRTQ